ncbi:MAG: gliding motility-associated C-terminal domain-containing protein [Bacteroides sp.]
MKELNKHYLVQKGILSLLSLFIAVQVCNGQGNPLWSDQPLPPNFRVVTVDPNTGKTTLTWDKPKPSDYNPEPQGYIIYRGERDASGNIDFQKVAELPPSQFSWIDDDAKGKEGVVQYRMATKGPDEKKPSKMTDPHATIYLKVEYLPCLNKIRLHWTQYGGWNNAIEHYVVHAGDHQSWSTLAEKATLKGNIWYYEFDAEQDKTWYIFIEARRSGSSDVTRSNMQEVKTRKHYIPSTILLDTIESSPNQNRVTLKMNLNTNPAYFRLVRQNVFSESEGKLDEIDVVRFTDPNTRVLIDTVGAYQIQGRKRFYSIVAMDECNEEVDRSQKSNSIIVRVASRGRRNVVNWDQLEVEDGNRAEYRIYRILTKPTGVEEVELATVNGGQRLEYVDDLTSLEDVGVTNKFCYKVLAYELTTDNSTKRVSISSPNCTQAESKIEIPTAISPLETASSGSTRVKRNVFAPKTTYDTDYKLYVYNRSGELIFTGISQGWDGRLRNGAYAPEGAYIYRIEFSFAERGSQTRTGSFMVVYPTR